MDGITIKDIARMCGVGVSTVSRALNGRSDINEKTRERILKCVAENGYVPNDSARNLKKADSDTVAAVIKDISNPVLINIARMLDRKIKEKGHSMDLVWAEPGENAADAALRAVREKRLRGVIILGGRLRESAEKLRIISVPCVLCCPVTADGIDFCSTVLTDDEEEGFKMTEYLISLGHRRIAILAERPESMGTGAKRLAGYKKALLRNGILYDKSLVAYIDPSEDLYSMKNGYRTVQRFLDGKPDFTALSCISDTMAAGAAKALSEAGIAVPGDVSVTGFDGTDAGKFFIPALTTMCRPEEEMAEKTVNILFDAMDGDTAPRHEVFPASLIKRESTGRLS